MREWGEFDSVFFNAEGAEDCAKDAEGACGFKD